MFDRYGLRAAALVLTFGFSLFHSPQLLARQTASLISAEGASPTVDEIVSRMVERNRERAEALRGFQGTRRYQMQYRGFFGSHDAEMTVKLTNTAPNNRQFTVVSQSGSKFIVEHVFKSLLDGEQEAMTPGNRERTALNAENYEFVLLGVESTQDGPEYVLNVTPRGDNKFLYRGKIWVDAKEFAVKRVEAEPAKSPSFWIKKSKINHSYAKIGDFWLPSEDRSESSIRLGGRAILSIEYKDYQIMDATHVAAAQSVRNAPASSESELATNLATKPSN